VERRERGNIRHSVRVWSDQKACRRIGASTDERPVCPSHQEPGLPVCREIQMPSGMPDSVGRGQDGRGGPRTGTPKRGKYTVSDIIAR
jgi:hypothetical protein